MLRLGVTRLRGGPADIKTEFVGARANGGHYSDRRKGRQFDEARGRAVLCPGLAGHSL
ncbi:hypothetical protein F4803DRAFT_557914 [Xylaria telfairii]|nr:hypothetical protein F4803DRAFT_557914 [Xylaria telfairii]